MMKRFVKSGKIIGLMLMALGLIFAGCAGPGGSGGSSETVAPATTQDSYGAIPISIDGKNGDLTVGSGSDGLSDLTMVAGHQIEIRDGNTSIVANKGNCGACLAGGDCKCWIKIVNKDPSAAMYNVNLKASTFFFGGIPKCLNCGTAVFNDADQMNGVPTHAIGGTVIDTPIINSGFCYAEDGNFGAKKPFNAMGCTTYYTPNASWKPVQALHPVCGQRSELFDFGNPSNPTAKYTFWASVSATYFPWNPVGADGIPNSLGAPSGHSGDDDARYDFQNYTTVYIILTDLRSGAAANFNQGNGRYVWGSWKRSAILAGYGSAGNVSGTALTVGSYFGVNVSVEAPDRLENYTMADKQHLANNTHGYEYYILNAIFFRYNPFVIERVRVAKGGTSKYIKPGAMDSCWSATGACGSVVNYETYSHLDPVADGSNSTYGFGWVAMYRSPEKDPFKYYANLSSQKYYPDAGGKIYIMTGAHVCQECGQKGFAKMNPAFLGATITPANTSAAKPAFIQEGVDAAPEENIMVYHFFVRGIAGNNVGKGSELRADVFSTYTQFQLALHPYPEKTTLLPGGASLDWADYCFPFNTTPPEIHYCPTPLNWTSDIIVFQSKERQNLAIGQSGEGVSGGGGSVQAWNTYVCVQ